MLSNMHVLADTVCNGLGYNKPRRAKNDADKLYQAEIPNDDRFKAKGPSVMVPLKTDRLSLPKAGAFIDPSRHLCGAVRDAFTDP